MMLLIMKKLTSILRPYILDKKLFTKYGWILLNSLKRIISKLLVSDDYEEDKVDINVADIKAYDGITGDDVTAKFDIKVENGVITANLKDGFTKSLGDAENTQVIDTTKFAFGRYYKFDIVGKVKDDVKVV